MNGTSSPSSISTPPLASDQKVHPSWMLSLRAVWAITWRTRIALRKLPLLVISLLAVPLLLYFTIPREGIRPFQSWVLDVYLSLLVPLYCLFVCGALIRDELQEGTLPFFLTRPISRGKYLCLAYLTQMAWLQLLGLALGLLLLLAGALRAVPDVGLLAPAFLGVQALAILVYSALSTLLGLLSKRYIILGLIYGLIVEMGIGRIPSNINALSMSHHLQTLLAHVESIGQARSWTPEGTGWSLLILLVTPCFLLGAAALLFSLREYHLGDERQK